MKIRQHIALLFLMISMASYSQDSKREQIKTLKIAYISKDLNLSSSEAEKFWPVYNAFDEKQFDLKMIKMRKIKQDLKNKPLENLTDAEANAILNQIDNLEDETFQNRKKLVADLRKVISPVKILKLKQAEDNFNKTLLKQYRKRN